MKFLILTFITSILLVFHVIHGVQQAKVNGDMKHAMEVKLYNGATK